MTTHPRRPQAQEQTVLKTQFTDEVKRLLDPASPEGRGVFIYLQRLIAQKNVHSLDVQDCIAEATAAGLAYIDKHGKEIRSATAWLKKVGANRIRNQVRVEIRRRKLKQKQEYQPESDNAWFKVLLDEERTFAAAAMDKLSPADQELLTLRFVLEMTYKDIKKYYFAQYHRSINVPALRKHASRALKRLKDQFASDYE